MLGFGGIFGRKPRQFDYKPRYFDPEKEARQERRRELLGERYDENAPAATEERIRGRMNAHRRTGGRSDRNHQKTFRLVVVLVLLVLFGIWMFFL